MKKLLFLLVFMSLVSFGQNIKSKDGITLGKRSDFVKGCVEGTEKSLKIGTNQVSGEKFCSCMADNLIPELYSYEILQAVTNNNFEELIKNEKNLQILLNCFMDIDEDINELFKDEHLYSNKNDAINVCIEEFKANDIGIFNNDKQFDQTVKDYCTCAIEKLLFEGYSFKEVMNIENEDNTAFNEVVIPCLKESGLDILLNQLSPMSINIYDPNDIVGDKYLSYVPLVDYLGKGYKIKITIDGITKYYLLDTGASDLIINREIERDLLINGSIRQEDYLGKESYILADNKEVNAQLVRLKNVKIGDYILNNVIAAIIDEGSLLCGTGLLNKFRKYELINDEGILILYK